MDNHSPEISKKVPPGTGSGELVPVIGPSGPGKPTMLNIPGVLDDYDPGTYILDHTLTGNLSERKAAFYRNRFAGFAFRPYNLPSFKNAMKNVALPLYYQKVRGKKRNKKALEYLEMVGLRAWAGHNPAKSKAGCSHRRGTDLKP